LEKKEEGILVRARGTWQRDFEVAPERKWKWEDPVVRQIVVLHRSD
jgi:hypothetical protein